MPSDLTFLIYPHTPFALPVRPRRQAATVAAAAIISPPAQQSNGKATRRGGAREGSGRPQKTTQKRTKAATRAHVNKTQLSRERIAERDKLLAERARVRRIRIKESMHTKVKRAIKRFSKVKGLYRTIWDDPLKHQWAVAIFNSCIENGMSKAAACNVVCRTIKQPHSLKPLSDRAVRQWISKYEKTTVGPNNPIIQRRKARWLLGEHPELQELLRQWVRANAKLKGKQRLKVKDFQEHVNLNVLKVQTPEALIAGDGITQEAARAWLHYLGFDVLRHSRAIFKDGHDDIENVEYRQLQYLPAMAEAQKHMLQPHHFLNPDDSNRLTLPLADALENARVEALSNGYDTVLLLLTHDECCFNSADCDGTWWGEKGADTMR